jgi:hypothetical protein
MNDTLAETLAIQALIAEVPHRIDGKRWSELRELYADQVSTDYRSLFGGEVQRQSGDALIESWRSLLTPVITQHLLGPVVVQIDGTRARARCHVRGYHYAEHAPGGPEWMVAGHYEFDLILSSAGWKIEQMALLASYQRGNRQLLQQAESARESQE